jgi:hypothetical protein
MSSRVKSWPGKKPFISSNLIIQSPDILTAVISMGHVTYKLSFCQIENHAHPGHRVIFELTKITDISSAQNERKLNV